MMIGVLFCEYLKVAYVEAKQDATLRACTKQLSLVICINRHPLVWRSGYIVTAFP